MKRVTHGTRPFYEALEEAIENILNGEESEESFDWGLKGMLGFRCWKDGDTVRVEIKSG